MQRPGIIFLDIDGTLVRSSLERAFLAYLRQMHRLSAVRLIRSAVALIASNRPWVWHRWKLFYLRGFDVQCVDEWVHDCWETRIRPRLYPGIVAAVRTLQSRGYRIVLLSGTPRPLAAPLMQWLACTDGIFAEPEIHNGRFTGRLLRPHPYGRRKRLAAETWLHTHGASWVSTWALANRWSDRHLLTAVAHPIAVRPDPLLRRLARRRRWPIIDRPQDRHAVQSILDAVLHRRSSESSPRRHTECGETGSDLL